MASSPGSISSSIISPVSLRPRSFASAVIAATAFKHGKVLKRSDSILDPANREFLMKQGAENAPTKHKKVILGSHTFKFDLEGDLVQTSPENSAPPSSPNTPVTDVESPQSRSQRLKEVFKRLHQERSLREQEENAKKLLRTNLSMVEKKDVYYMDNKMHLSLQEGVENDKKNRPSLVRQLKIEDCVNEIKDTDLNKNLLIEVTKVVLENKESFELEEISAGEHGGSSNFHSPVTVEGSFLSESSGFEDSLCSPLGKFEFVSNGDNEESVQNSIIPPVEVTTWDSTSDQTDPIFITSSPNSSPKLLQRSRYSDPSISLYSLQLPNEQCSSNINQLSPASSSMSRNSSSGTITDGNHSSNSSLCHFEKQSPRKGSYPQPTPRKWAPIRGISTTTLPRHFLWTMTDAGSRTLSSSQTTLTNCDQAPHESSNCCQKSPFTMKIDYERSKSATDASCQVGVEDLDEGTNGINPHMRQRRATWCPTSSTKYPQSLLSKNIALAKDDLISKNQALLELQSMKLSLEQYRLQSQQLESSSLRFLRLYPLLSADQISSLESVHRLRLEIFREIGRMEELLSQHVNLVKANRPSDYKVLNFRFSHAIEQMSSLLREQAMLCRQLDDIASSSEDKTKTMATELPKDRSTIDYVVGELSLLRQQLQFDQQSQQIKFKQLIEEAKNEILENVKQFVKSHGNIETTPNPL